MAINNTLYENELKFIGNKNDEIFTKHIGLTNYELELKRIILDAESNPNWEKDLKMNADKLRLLSMKLF